MQIPLARGSRKWSFIRKSKTSKKGAVSRHDTTWFYCKLTPTGGTDIPVARKIIRVGLGDVTGKDVENEVRALNKLCVADKGKLLIRVFDHGPSEESGSCFELYHIDMEYCKGNLKNLWVSGDLSSIREILSLMATESASSDSVPNFEGQLNARLSQISTLLYQIVQGLEFIHSMKSVHRDLKPENSASLILHGI